MRGLWKTAARTRNLQPNRLSIEWSPAALVTFYRLSIHSATMIDRAVIQLAETGQGRVHWVAPYYRLYVGSYDLPLVLDRQARSLTVLHIYNVRGGRMD